ncbi:MULTISPECIES: hypothetical protein [Nostocales]|uniref:Uncharacterized protein n=3 Tax=Nostocales TaxID=1161 RepID=A0A8S9T9Q5_9CYAN|nr:hypothetical protein [Tolypothrix bouteillei]KAF3888747.1 hypothetical protein DA73_0400027140 [Tolypothrix bouteillei VB521301]
MLEKLLLAAGLTFSLSLFAELGLPSSWRTPRGRTGQSQTVITLTPQKN